jgi:hypothetical protein
MDTYIRHGTLPKRREDSSGLRRVLYCYAFFDICANAAVIEGMDALSTGPPKYRQDQVAAVALIRRAGHSTHPHNDKGCRRTRMGFLYLTKGGQARSDTDRVFSKLAHERI